MGHPAPATFFPFFTRRAGSVTALKRSEPTAAMLARPMARYAPAAQPPPPA